MTENNKVLSPFIHSHITIDKMMRQVIIALVPGIIVSTWMLGWGVLIHCLIAVIFSLGFESIALTLRGKPLRPFLFDGSVIITGLLFALSITPFAPWWVVLSGLCFAVFFSKQVYGGLGYNIFNPAMAGYAFVLICFPSELNYWPASGGHDFIQSLKILFAGSLYDNLDSLSGATPLAFTQIQMGNMKMLSELSDITLFGGGGNKGWGWINLAFFSGGCWLMIKRIIKWEIPIIILCTLFLFSAISHGYNPEQYTSATLNLFAGGTWLAAFFIATDPVTSSTTRYGRIIYAAGIGSLIYVIRTWGSYADGIAFSILIMNAMVPLIDYATRPKVFGKTINK